MEKRRLEMSSLLCHKNMAIIYFSSLEEPIISQKKDCATIISIAVLPMRA